MRRRVKEQQKRIGSAEFRNTQFSFSMGLEGVEKFVATPELQSEDNIGIDPLPSGQVWAISPGTHDENAGLFRIEVNEGPGSGFRILTQAPPAPFRESANFAIQNLYTRGANWWEIATRESTSLRSNCVRSMLGNQRPIQA
jgi:ATP-dependent Lon protease